MYELKVGMRLFHKNKMGVVRECELIRIYYEVDGYEKIDVKLFEKVMITGENEPRDIFSGISSKSIGEFLFFEKEHTQLSISDLANIPDYVRYGNKDICEVYDEITIRKRMYERENRNITEILETRKINYLVYFTRIENLTSILTNGIVPEMQHEEMGIVCKKNNCKKRYGFQKQGNGYSIEFPNYRLFNRLRADGQETDRYVMLRLDAKEVLLNTIDKQVYCSDNALTNSDKYGAYGLSELFLPVYQKEGYEYEEEYHREIYIKRAELNIPDNYSTNPQAEIIICETVDPKYIKQVVFENNNDKQSWLDSNGGFQNKSLDYIVDSKLFGPRYDWQFWQ